MVAQNNCKSCSFCNLFSAIESMMQELKEDHERNVHQDNVLTKGLVQPLQVQRVNAALPLLSLDVKREQIKETKQYVVYEYVKNGDASSFSNFLGSVKQENEMSIADEVCCDEDNNDNKPSLKRMESFKVESDIKHSITDVKKSKLSETENVCDPVQLEEKQSKVNVIWNNFQMRNDIRNGRECNHCGKVLKSTYGTTTTSLINHLKRKHPETLGTQKSHQKIKRAIREEKRSQSNKLKSHKLGRSNKSIIWDHFKSLPDGSGGMVCNNCGIKISTAGATTNMINHLKNKHPQLLGIHSVKYIEHPDIQAAKQKEDKEEFGIQLDRENKLEEELGVQSYQENNHLEQLYKEDRHKELEVQLEDVWHQKIQQKRNSTNETTKSKMNELLNSYQYRKEISPEKRTCKYCGKVFSTRGSMSHHIKTVHLKTKSYTCDLCGKHFSMKNSIDRHLITHKEEKTFKCIYCPKSFIRKYRKDAHEKSHKNIFDHGCDYCSKAFTSKQRKIHHERIHTGEKPHLCTNCGKAFRLRSAFRTHLLIHTEEKPYHCQHCDKNYRHLSSYRDHRCPGNFKETGTIDNFMNRIKF